MSSTSLSDDHCHHNLINFQHELTLFGKNPSYLTRDSKIFNGAHDDPSSLKNHFSFKRMNEDQNGGHFLDYRI